MEDGHNPGDPASALERWRAAGLVEPAQVEAILEWERTRPAGPRQPTVPGVTGSPDAGLTLTEVMAYVAVALGLVGIAIVVWGGHISEASRGLVLALLSGAAWMLARMLARREDGPSRRGADACQALALALSGAAVGELLADLNLLALTGPGYDGFPGSTSHAADVVAGAFVATAGGALLVRSRRAVLASAIATIALYVGLSGLLDLLNLDRTPLRPLIALGFAIAGALAILLAEPCPSSSMRSTTAFAAVFLAAVMCYAQGGSPNIEIDALGGAISVAAAFVGLQWARTGLAFGGAVGMAGLVVDVGARNVSSADALGLVLVLAALVGLALIVGIQRIATGRPGPA